MAEADRGSISLKTRTVGSLVECKRGVGMLNLVVKAYVCSENGTCCVVCSKTSMLLGTSPLYEEIATRLGVSKVDLDSNTVAIIRTSLSVAEVIARLEKK